MVERQPKGKKNDAERTIEYISEITSKDKIFRSLLNTYIKAKFYTMVGLELIVDPDFRDVIFSDPSNLRVIFNKEAFTGLLAESIISNPLYFPNDNGTSINGYTEPAGDWLGFDFHRKEEFGQKADQVMVGSIFAYPLREVILNSSQTYTPTYTLDMLSFEHNCQMDKPSMIGLINYGFVEECSYGDAFTKAGVYDKYATALKMKKLVDLQVFQVTPKGNGLVFLDSKYGDPEPKQEEQKQLKLAWQTY